MMCRNVRLRRFPLAMVIISALVCVSPLLCEADPRPDLTFNILRLFPSFSGTVQQVEGPMILVQMTPGYSVDAGAYLLVHRRNQTWPRPSLAVLLRVVTVNGQDVRAEQLGENEIRKGDPVAGWPRPLRLALVPMSSEVLQLLLKYPLPKGDLDPVRVEDVLTTMIQNYFGDFSRLETMDVTALAAQLQTPLVVQVSILSGFGEKVLQMQPHWVEAGQKLGGFSILLLSRTTFFEELPPDRPDRQKPKIGHSAAIHRSGEDYDHFDNRLESER